MATSSLDRVLNLATLAAVGVGAWWLWNRGKDVKAAAEAAGAAAGDAYVWLTEEPPIVPIGTVRMPNGSTLPVASIIVDQKFGFTWGGARYTLTGRNAAGEFVAVPRVT